MIKGSKIVVKNIYYRGNIVYNEIKGYKLFKDWLKIDPFRYKSPLFRR